MFLLFTVLVGCGGGGGGSSPTGSAVSTMSFPLQSAYQALIAAGATANFTVSGTCTGTGNRTVTSATTPTTFESVSGFSSVGSLTMSLSGCSPASIAQSYISYFDSNYVPLGSNVLGIRYGLYQTPPTIPSSVSVGGTGIIGTETFYTDSTKATGDGRSDTTYIIEAESQSTAIVNLITKDYNSAGILTATEQSRFRIGTTGALIPVSTDIQYSNISTTHLLLTYN